MKHKNYNNNKKIEQHIHIYNNQLWGNTHTNKEDQHTLKNKCKMQPYEWYETHGKQHKQNKKNTWKIYSKRGPTNRTQKQRIKNTETRRIIKPMNTKEHNTTKIRPWHNKTKHGDNKKQKNNKDMNNT